MNYKDVIIGSTSHKLVHIDEIELSARLGGLISILDEDIKQHIEIFNNNVTYRYAYVKVNFKYDDGLCCFDNLSVKSSSLSKVLKGSKEAILIAVTAGTSIDKLISKYEILNQSSAFYFDSIGSAAIESYMNYITEYICKELNVTKRFSPGYSDFPLEFQSLLLDRIGAKENIGIELSSDCLMIPMKSITAVIGIK